MFTGIVEEVGTVLNIDSTDIKVKASIITKDLKTGDSIAVNGACLTVTHFDKDSFCADISPETLSVTALKNISANDCVNLERAMSANGRFGGHIVTGHIDGVAKVKNITKTNNFYDIEFELADELKKYTVNKGSITVNGISLTIAKSYDKTVKIAVIPHTYENTNFKQLKIGSFVNIETDILAKYVEKFLSTSDNKSGISMEFLEKHGF